LSCPSPVGSHGFGYISCSFKNAKLLQTDREQIQNMTINGTAPLPDACMLHECSPLREHVWVLLLLVAGKVVSDLLRKSAGVMSRAVLISAALAMMLAMLLYFMPPSETYAPRPLSLHVQKWRHQGRCVLCLWLDTPACPNSKSELSLCSRHFLYESKLQYGPDGQPYPSTFSIFYVDHRSTAPGTYTVCAS